MDFSTKRSLHRLYLALAWSALGIGSVGCVSAEDSKRQKQCESICAKFYMCNSSNDAERCERRCEAEGWWSEAYWEHRTSCVRGATCDQLPSSFNDLIGHVRVDDCIESALRSEPLTEEQERTCVSTSTKLVSCDASLDVDILRLQCTRGPVRQLDEDYLAESADCIHLNTCPDIQQCLDHVVEDHGARVRLYDVELDLD